MWNIGIAPLISHCGSRSFFKCSNATRVLYSKATTSWYLPSRKLASSQNWSPQSGGKRNFLSYMESIPHSSFWVP